MNSLKRLFSSILPTSWIGDENGKVRALVNDNSGRAGSKRRRHNQQGHYFTSEHDQNNFDGRQNTNSQIQNGQDANRNNFQSQGQRFHKKFIRNQVSAGNQISPENEQIPILTNQTSERRVRLPKRFLKNKKAQYFHPSDQESVEDIVAPQSSDEVLGTVNDNDDIDVKNCDNNTEQKELLMQSDSNDPKMIEKSQQIQNKSGGQQMIIESSERNQIFQEDNRQAQNQQSVFSQIDKYSQNLVMLRKEYHSGQNKNGKKNNEFSFGSQADKQASQLEKRIQEKSNQLKENLNKQQRAANQSLKKIEGLNCPVCMDYIISCRIAVCGHSFCHQCISECLIRKKDCPQCRKTIRRKALQQTLMIDNAVKLMVQGKRENGQIEEFQRWQERMKKYQDWLESHRVKSVKAGEKLDVCDTEYIWCKATVELVCKAKNRKDLLYIHYEGWNRQYDEYLYIDSNRVCPLGLYTSRSDIPVYKMRNSSASTGPLSMMYAVVLQNAAEEARLAEYERLQRRQAARRNQNQNPNQDEDEISVENNNNNTAQLSQADEFDRPSQTASTNVNNSEIQQGAPVMTAPSLSESQINVQIDQNQQQLSSTAQTGRQPIEAHQDSSPINEIDFNRTIDHVNNQLEQSRIRQSSNGGGFIALAQSLRMASQPQRNQPQNQEMQISSLVEDLEPSERPQESQIPQNQENQAGETNLQGEIDPPFNPNSKQLFQGQVQAFEKLRQQQESNKLMKELEKKKEDEKNKENEINKDDDKDNSNDKSDKK